MWKIINFHTILLKAITLNYYVYAPHKLYLIQLFVYAKLLPFTLIKKRNVTRKSNFLKNFAQYSLQII